MAVARVSRGQKAALVVTALLALVVSCSVAYRGTADGHGNADTNTGGASTGAAGAGTTGTATTNAGTTGTARSALVPVGSSTHFIRSGGRQRTFILYRPAGLIGPAPLVVMLHGGFGSDTQAESYYGWNAEGGFRALPGGVPGRREPRVERGRRLLRNSGRIRHR